MRMVTSWNDIDKISKIIFGSNICSNHCTTFKFVQHFSHLQCIANKFSKNLIHVYGVAGHSKGEFNHFGGQAKVKISRRVAAGVVFLSSSETAEFLDVKFKDNTKP